MVGISPRYGEGYHARVREAAELVGQSVPSDGVKWKGGNSPHDAVTDVIRQLARIEREADDVDGIRNGDGGQREKSRRKRKTPDSEPKIFGSSGKCVPKS